MDHNSEHSNSKSKFPIKVIQALHQSDDMVSSWNKLSIKDGNRIFVFDYDKILYCSTDRIGCKIYLSNGNSISMGKSLKFLEEELDSPIFARIHASYLVNLNKINRIVKENQWVIFIDNHQIPVSKSKAHRLLDLLH